MGITYDPFKLFNVCDEAKKKIKFIITQFAGHFVHNLQ